MVVVSGGHNHASLKECKFGIPNHCAVIADKRAGAHGSLSPSAGLAVLGLAGWAAASPALAVRWSFFLIR